MNKVLIIYCHPYTKSFNHAILEQVLNYFALNNKPYDLIDLHADHFDPRYNAEELSLFSKGETLDPLVVSYQEKIRNASSLIIITPVWWSDIPGMLKGFFDKMMKLQFAYMSTSLGVKGLLTHIHSAMIITTSTSPTWYLKLFCGNAIRSVFLNAVLRQMGISNRKWMNCGRVNLTSQSKRTAFLNKVQNKIKIFL